MAKTKQPTHKQMLIEMLDQCGADYTLDDKYGNQLVIDGVFFFFDASDRLEHTEGAPGLHEELSEAQIMAEASDMHRQKLARRAQIMSDAVDVMMHQFDVLALKIFNQPERIDEMETLNLKALVDKCHGASKAAGWWHDLDTGEPLERNDGELVMLMISEVSEAMEGLRKNLMDDKLVHRKMEEVELADAAIRICDYLGGRGYFEPGGLKYDEEVDHQEDYLTYCRQDVKENDAENLRNICRFLCRDQFTFALGLITAYAHKKGYNLIVAINEKLAYNASRADHKPENRRAAGGKKF